MRRRKRRFVYAGGVAVVVLFLCGIITALSYLPQIRISQVEVKGLSTLSEDEVRGHISSILAQKYLFILPKTNIFLYPRTEIERSLLSSYPKLLSVDVSFKDFNAISVALEERSPFALWCEEGGADHSCTFLDKGGYGYAPAPEFSGTVFVRYRGGENAEAVGREYLSSQIFRSLSALVAELGKQGEPSDVEVTKEGDVEVLFLEGFALIFPLGEKPESILERLRLALQSESLSGIELGELSYIDLRFGDRVVYKFK